MTRRARVVLAAMVLAGGCYQSAPPDADGGADGGADGSADGGDDGCTVGGYRRCGGECPTRCSDGLCFEEISLCLPTTGGYPCTFRTRPPEAIASGSCPLGWGCWFDGLETPADGERAYCAPPDACLLAPPDVPPHRCFWSDGTEVTRVPPGDECPDYEDIPWSTCGNSACGGFFAGECETPGGCAGVSDERGFGLCHLGGNACDPENPVYTELCEGTLSTPCACMVNEPPAPATVEPYGFLVPLEACERYALRYPGQVRCATP